MHILHNANMPDDILLSIQFVQLIKRSLTVNDYIFLLRLSSKVHQAYFIFHVAMSLYNIN